MTAAKFLNKNNKIFAKDILIKDLKLTCKIIEKQRESKLKNIVIK
jgi:hypothetical protein